MEGKKKTVFIIIIVVIILIIGYLIYSNFFNQDIEEIQPSAELEIKILVVPKIESEFADDFLTKPPYSNFKEHAKLPVTVDKKGRKNPFRAISFSLFD